MKEVPVKPQVICAGRLYCDLVFTGLPRFPSPGTETFASGVALHAGGGAFITAAAMRSLGWATALWSTLPGAPFDRVVTDAIAASKVDMRPCQPAPPESSPQITIAIAAGADRTFLSHKSGAAIPEFDLARFSDTLRHLHIGELRTLCEHPHLIDQARSGGLTISLDCAWDDELLAKPDAVASLISQVDVFLPNEAEQDQLVARGLPEIIAPLTVVKCGASGAKASAGNGWVHCDAIGIDVVDATGAGDAFNGGFLASWLSGDTLERCLSNGNTCGAVAAQSVGGTEGFDLLRAGVVNRP